MNFPKKFMEILIILSNKNFELKPLKSYHLNSKRPEVSYILCGSSEDLWGILKNSEVSF